MYAMRRKISHMTYFTNDYRAETRYHLGERAHFYFYHFALIVFMNKRLMLTPTASFASRYLQLHSSLGYVHPCTVYNTASSTKNPLWTRHISCRVRSWCLIVKMCTYFWWEPVWSSFHQLLVILWDLFFTKMETRCTGRSLRYVY